jgi:tetratricopeptide (TPR) repeat protein
MRRRPPQPQAPAATCPRPRPSSAAPTPLRRSPAGSTPATGAGAYTSTAPAGIGKSALALEAAHRAPAERYPLKLWVTAKTRELHPEGERKLEGRHPGDFTAILDAFARALDRDDLPRLTPEDRPAALHAALAAHRALLVVDNLEALAPAERRRVLDWLNLLPQSCRALVTSRRRDDSLAGHALQVDKLDRAAADQLLTALGERQPPVARLTDGERERLYNETGGNPLLLTWIAAQLGRTTGRCRTLDAAVARLHDADRRAHEAGNDPLAYVFGDLVESFTPDETKVLAALAHFTRPASVDWLLPMTDLSRRAAETALDGLRDRALLIEDEAAGTWLLPPACPPATYAGCGRRRSGKRGRGWPTRSTRWCKRTGGGSTTASHCSTPRGPGWRPRCWCCSRATTAGSRRCATRWAHSSTTPGRWDERLALSEAAEARALAAGDLDSAGWRAHDAGFCHNRRGQAAPVLAAAGRAAAHWRLAGDPARERAIAIRLRGLGHELADERDAALAAGEEVLALFRARDPGRADVALALNDVARRLHWLGRHDEAEARYREALALARRVGYVEGVATYTANLAELALDRGRPAEAEALACEALALAGPLGRRDFIGDCCTHLARALAAQGRGVEGRPHAERAVDLLATLRAPKLLNAQAALAACVAPPAPPRPD